MNKLLREAKRIITLILSLVIFITALPLYAFADEFEIANEAAQEEVTVIETIEENEAERVEAEEITDSEETLEAAEEELETENSEELETAEDEIEAEDAEVIEEAEEETVEAQIEEEVQIEIEAEEGLVSLPRIDAHGDVPRAIDAHAAGILVHVLIARRLVVVPDAPEAIGLAVK